MGKVNYSIRLDEDLREQMREVPDMTDRIREFIQREVRNHQRDGESPEESFCHRIIDDYGEVGAYTLYQLVSYVRRDKHLLGNIEARFAESDIDVQRAQLEAKKVRDQWEDSSIRFDEDIVEEVLDQHGYVERFATHAREVAAKAVEHSDLSRWGFWTVAQLVTSQNEGRQRSSYKTQKKSLAKTLEQGRGITEDQFDQVVDDLLAAGIVQGFYSSNAYMYRYLRVADFIVDGIVEGLQPMEHKIRSRVQDYAEVDHYLEAIAKTTRGEGTLYRREMDGETDEELLSDLVSDGAVVIRHRPHRSSSGRRSSLPSRSQAILVPAVREVIGDAFYRRETTV